MDKQRRMQDELIERMRAAEIRRPLEARIAGLERANSQLQRERDELKHDIERHVKMCADQADEIERLTECEAVASRFNADMVARIAQLERALRQLRNEVSALECFEQQLRGTMGNSNYNILMERKIEADAALAAEDKP